MRHSPYTGQTSMQPDTKKASRPTSGEITGGIIILALTLIWIVASIPTHQGRPFTFQRPVVVPPACVNPAALSNPSYQTVGMYDAIVVDSLSTEAVYKQASDVMGWRKHQLQPPQVTGTPRDFSHGFFAGGLTAQDVARLRCVPGIKEVTNPWPDRTLPMAN
jgi:hypothetical protein